MRNPRPFSLPLMALTVFAFALAGQTRVAGADYTDALNGVSQVKAIFDVRQGSAFKLNRVFWAVRNVYQDSTVKGLPKPPQAAIVFRGPAVKLLSTDPKHYKQQNQSQVKEFQDLLREMKADGVKIEACQFALKSAKVDFKTVIPEINQVENGFVSIVGYQSQGYVVVVP